jgi:hypothetical protein
MTSHVALEADNGRRDCPRQWMLLGEELPFPVAEVLEPVNADTVTYGYFPCGVFVFKAL